MQKRSIKTLMTLPLAFMLTASLGPSDNDGDLQRRLTSCQASSGEATAIADCTALIMSRQFHAENLAKLYFARAQNYQLAGKYELALADCDKALAMSPGMVAVEFGRGLLLVELHKPEQALQALLPLTHLAPPQLGVRSLFIAETYDDLGRHPEALKTFDQAIAQLPADNRPKLAHALSHYRYGEYLAAFSEIEDLLKAEPKSVRYLGFRGAVLRHLDRAEEGLRDLDAALVLAPQDTLNLQARCWHRAALQKEFNLAKADCEAALHLKPEDASIRGALGFLQLRMKRYNDAIADYTSALSVNARSASSLFGRGVARRNLGQKLAGDADIAAAEAIDPRVRQNYADDGVSP